MPARMTAKQASALGLEGPRTRLPEPDEAQAASMRQALFLAACKAHNLPLPVPEARFHPTRLWRFDYLWVRCPDGWPAGIALEIDGGAWTQGRHTRGKGYVADMEKLNEAAIMGYIVLRVTPQQEQSGEVFELIRRAHEAFR